MQKKLMTIILFLFSPALCLSAQWSYYGGAAGGGHYSALAQITKENVRHLQKAWEFHTGDISSGTATIAPTTFEATPILLANKIYFCTPYNRVMALNPATGKLIWHFDPKLDAKVLEHGSAEGNLICRGVASWHDNKNTQQQTCATRIFTATQDARLIALDAETGELCKDFGKHGTVDLREGVLSAFDMKQLKPYGLNDKLTERFKYLIEKVAYGQTSPPAVIHNLVIVGSAIADNIYTHMPSGVVRAYDAKTGKLKWRFEPIPAEFKKLAGAANTWAPISVDIENNLVFIGTSSPSADFFGGTRQVPLQYVDAVVALHADTGKPEWSFQTVHHDIFDYDLAAQPTLVNIKRDGKEVPATIVATKSGMIFVFDRLTGRKLFPVEERSVPQSTVPGEKSAPTQPFPILPKPLIDQSLTKNDMWGLIGIDELWCRKEFSKSRYEGLFTPPSLEGTILFPMTGGGINWGGVAYSPETNLLIVNYSRVAHRIKLLPREVATQNAIKKNVLGGVMLGTPYGVDREVFLSPLGIPCNAPPWGMLAAIDMQTGEVRWSQPFGSVKKGPFYSLEKWGSPNMGGSLVTASGLIFIGASMNDKFHAYDLNSGEKLWETTLPAMGGATPMTYEVNGEQYVVIAAGGVLDGPKALQGDSLIAYKLRKQ